MLPVRGKPFTNLSHNLTAPFDDPAQPFGVEANKFGVCY
jgi:hypothetical protein